MALLLVVLGVGSALVLGRWQPDAGARHGASVVTRASRAPITAAATVSKGIAPTPSGGPFERMLVMRAVEPTWVRVQPDGNEPTKETLAPGSVRQWHRAGRFRVTLENAGGVELELHGQTLPALGERGRVVWDVILPFEGRP